MPREFYAMPQEAIDSGLPELVAAEYPAYIEEHPPREDFVIINNYHSKFASYLMAREGNYLHDAVKTIYEPDAAVTDGIRDLWGIAKDILDKKGSFLENPAPRFLRDIKYFRAQGRVSPTVTASSRLGAFVSIASALPEPADGSGGLLSYDEMTAASGVDSKLFTIRMHLGGRYGYPLAPKTIFNYVDSAWDTGIDVRPQVVVWDATTPYDKELGHMPIVPTPERLKDLGDFLLQLKDIPEPSIPSS